MSGEMRWDVFVWLAIALLLVAAEVLAPGAFMLWLAFAAAAVFVLVWLFPEMSFLLQAIAFVVLGFASIQIYRTWFRRTGEPETDQPALNRRAAQLVGRVVALETAIERGSGRVQIADAYWTVSGPDLPAGVSVRIVGAEGMTLKVEAVD
jgi:inner membrane protein